MGDTLRKLEYAALYIPSQKALVIGSCYDKCERAGRHEFPDWDSLKKTKGFMTNTHHFFSQAQGRFIAEDAGQLRSGDHMTRLIEPKDVIAGFEYTRVINNFST